MFDWSISYDKSRNNFGYVYERSDATENNVKLYNSCTLSPLKLFVNPPQELNYNC